MPSFICRLRFFEIDVDLGPLTSYDFDILSFLIGSFRVSLASPATLERLKFSISLHNKIGDIDGDTFFEYLRDFWTHLDDFITHPNGSQLQQVGINIRVDCYLRFRDFGRNMDEPDEHSVLTAVLDGFPLLRWKDILFVEVNSTHSCARYESGITDSAEFCVVLPGTV